MMANESERGFFRSIKELTIKLADMKRLGMRIKKLLKGGYSRAAREHRELNARMDEEHRELNTRMDQMYRELYAGIDWMHLDLNQKVTQFQTQYMRGQINELRQRKKILIVGSGEHPNIGDSAIAMAMQKLLLKQYPEYYQMEFSTYDLDREYSFLQAIINEEDIFFLAGGGNLGNRYMIEEEVRRRIISDFIDMKIVIMPQTIFFDDTEEGRNQLALSERVYNRHPDLTLFTRGAKSRDFAKEHFKNARVELMVDAAFALQRDYGFEREGALLCLRADDEAICAQNDRNKIRELVTSMGLECECNTNMAQMEVDRTIRASVVNEELKRHASKQLVITDRLHGMIFAVLTNTPVVVIKSVDQKIEDYYETFLKDSNAIFYIGTQLERLEAAVKSALAVENPSYPIFDDNPIYGLRKMIEELDRKQK